MRIAIIGTRGVPARYGGFETCAEQVGRRMVDRGHDVTVYCRSVHYQSRPATHLGMRLRYIPALRSKHLETISHTFLSALTGLGDSAVICFGVGNAPVVRALELRGRRTVLNVDGADWRREKWGGMARRYLRAAETMAAHSHSELVADAEVVARYYQERFHRDTHVVPYGALAPADTGTEVLDELGLSPGGYMLFVGRLEPENGPHDFLDAAGSADLGVPAVVVGDATYADDYIASLKQQAPPSALFTGYRFGSAYQQLSAHAGVYVLAASVGGTHPVLTEQMAAANCILARDTDSNREVLGDAGILWRDTADLTEQLKRAWGDEALRSRLGAAARERQLQRYDWERVTDGYLELCARVRSRN